MLVELYCLARNGCKETTIRHASSLVQLINCPPNRYRHVNIAIALGYFFFVFVVDETGI